jgi:predicted transcriptional regulator
MEILHRRRRATVEDLRSELPKAPSRSSVRKLLDIMIERGLLAREYDGPGSCTSRSQNRKKASRSAVRQLLQTFFNDSPSSAVAALLDAANEPLSDAEYKRLNALLKKARESGGQR